MTLLPGARMDDWTPAPLPEPKPARTARPAAWRHYVGARLSGGNVLASLQSKDAELRKDLLALRRNSRALHNNNPFMRRYLRTLGAQVVGPHGVRLQSKAPGAYAARIEDSYTRWCAQGVCTVDGRLSFPGVQRNFLKTVAQDGECFIRLILGARNPWGFALQFLDADLLDHTFNVPASDGRNAIVMGVEVDPWGRPVAFWFSDPRQVSTLYNRAAKIRIPAEEIIHGFDPERAATQTRGVPWASSAMYLMDMLGHYWESEVAAARHEAERPGFIESEVDTGEDGTEGVPPVEGESDAQGPSGADVVAGMPPTLAWSHVPAGFRVNIPDLQHPATAFGEFSKAMLKGIASGLGISYASLSSDLTQVSFASIRQGVLEDRDWYRELQQELLIQTLCERVFLAWFDMAVISGQLVLPQELRYEKAIARSWRPRGWAWVDPKADSAAQAQDIASGTTSRQRICASRGEDFAEVLEELAWEQKELEAKGVTVLVGKTPLTSEPEEDPDGQA